MYNDSRVTQTIHRMTVKQRRYDDDSDDDDINVDDNADNDDDEQRRTIHPALPLLARLGVRAAALRRINSVCRHLGVHHVTVFELSSLLMINLSQSSRVDVAWHCCWLCLPTNVLIFTAKPNDCSHRCHGYTWNERCLNVQNKIYLLSVESRVTALFSAICCVENRVCVVCHVLPPTIVPTMIIIFQKTYT